MMEHEKAYVYQPQGERPAKRRKVAPSEGLHATWKLRHDTYTSVWGDQQKKYDERLSSLHLDLTSKVFSFLEETVGQQEVDSIPTGIVLAGPQAGHGLSTRHLQDHAAQYSTRRTFATINASSGSNLKALLKTVIQRITSTQTGLDEDDDADQSALQSRRGPRLMNYDLQIVHDFVREWQTQQIIIVIEDTEAFSSRLLSDFIDLLGCWTDRIPFVFLMSIATSVDFLQQQLSKAAVKCLKGRIFEAPPASETVEQAFAVMTDGSVPIWIGPELARAACERQNDFIIGADQFESAVQYAYMSTFYANALSLFLLPNLQPGDVPPDHCEAARILPSFQEFARTCLEDRETQSLRHVLESDETLFELVRAQILHGGACLAELVAAVDVIRILQETLSPAQVSPRSSLYIQAMSNKLQGSPLLRQLFLSVRRLPSDDLARLAETLLARSSPDEVMTACKALTTDLNKLISHQPDNAPPLRSEDDVKNSTLRTTVVAQKVELSKQKAALSKDDAAYTALLRRFSDTLEEYFAAKLLDPTQLMFHEIFIYDLRSPHREVFTPRPRHAVERALAAPNDYLDCECCARGKDGDGETTLAATQPPTAVLYQLYLESGNLINVYDLWQAFHAVIGDNEESEEQTMALFQRSLAELRYMGVVKSTRKRADHIVKTAWRGL